MKEYRKIKIGVIAACMLLLLVVLGYSEIKESMDRQRQKDISLSTEQADTGYQDAEGQAGSGKAENTQAEIRQQEPDLSARAKIPQVTLGMEDLPDMRVSLWQSNSGICYFFLPGFAKGKSLILDKAPDVRVQIGGREASEGDRLHDIREGEAYELVLSDEEGERITDTSVIFMYSSDLPVLHLTTLSGEMAAVDEDKTNKETGKAAVFDETGTEIYTGRVDSIRGRGNSTWGLSKKPYQFKLAERVDFLGLGEGKSWNLLANAYDETKLRNQITLQLASALGMNYVPDGKMIDLYINDIYYGNYFLTEKIKIGRESVDIRDMEAAADAAYSGEDLENIRSFQNEEGTRKWTDDVGRQGDITGGYLFERELPYRFQEEISGFVTAQGDCYALKSPVCASKEQVDYIAELMQAFQDAVTEEDGIHPVTGRHYSEYIDITSFAQKYLVEEISKNYDGGVTSSFFYKPQDAVSSKIYAGPVWDYDVAFGNCNLDEIASNPIGLTKLSDHVYGTRVFAQLYDKEDFYVRVAALYKEKGLPYLTELLEEGIDNLVRESRDSVQMDSIRWEDLENRYQYYKEYDNDVRYLRYFIEKRMNFLNEVWLEGEIYHNVTFVSDGEQWQVNCVKDGELPGEEPIPARNTGGSLFMGWVTEEGIPYDKFKPIYEDITFHAVWQELPLPELAEP